jgi:hypothetical protein
MVTARMVGGDFYDLFQIDPARIGFLIGDVAGKGVLAGLFMTATRALMRATAGQYALPGECLSRVNQLLCRENVPAMYVTMFYGYWIRSPVNLNSVLAGTRCRIVSPAMAPIQSAERVVRFSESWKTLFIPARKSG